MLALEARDVEFVRRWLAAAVAACERRRAIRRATADFAHVRQPRARIRHTADHQAMVQQRRMKRSDRRFLAAVLGRGRGKHTADLADERALGPQAAGLVKEGT